jgi:hypothetical protein
LTEAPWLAGRACPALQLFFIVVILILMNILFGIIIDTFGDLRQERQGASCLRLQRVTK